MGLGAWSMEHGARSLGLGAWSLGQSDRVAEYLNISLINEIEID